MKTRRLGKTDFLVSEIGLGTWQLGGDFGPIEDMDASTILANAARLGVNFWDTADVYGNGLSEHRIGTFYGKPDGLVVATKVGRAAALYPDKYTKGGVRESLEESARRLCVDSIDLAQLHCVPREVLEAATVAMNAGAQAEQMLRVVAAGNGLAPASVGELRAGGDGGNAFMAGGAHALNPAAAARMG